MQRLGEEQATAAATRTAPAAAADAEGNELGKLFVGGLSQVTNECSLRAHFGQFGPVEDAVVMMDNQTGRSRGFGFVKFKDPTGVDAALDAAAGHVIDGKPVDVKQSNINVKGKTSRSLKVFVGGIAPEHDASMVREFFGQYGRVTDVNLMLDQSKQRHRGFAFVAFDDERTVQHLVQLHFVDIGGRVVEIKAMKPPNFEARAAAAAAAAAAVSSHSSAEPIYRADFAAAGAAAVSAAAVSAPMPATWPPVSFPCDPGFSWAGGAFAWPGGYYGQPGGGQLGQLGLLETCWPMQPFPPPPQPPPPPPAAPAWAPAGWMPQTAAVVAWPGSQQQLQQQQSWPSLLPPPPPPLLHQPQPQPPPPVIQPLGCWDQNLHQWPPRHSLPPPPPPPPPYQAALTDATDAIDEGQAAGSPPPSLPRHRRRPSATAARGGDHRALDPAGFCWLYPKDPPADPLAGATPGGPVQSSLSHVAAGDFDRCDGSDVAAGFRRDI